MSAAAEQRVEIGRPKSDDELDHLVCCDDPVGAVSLCGLDLSDHLFVDVDSDHSGDCIVCADIWENTNECPRHGYCHEDEASS